MVVRLLRSFTGALVLLGLVCLFIAGAMAFIAPDLGGATLALTGIGLLFLLAALMGAIEAVRGTLLGRHGRFGANTAAMIAAFVGIAILSNVLVSRQSYRLDLTANQSRTLAPQTVSILGQLRQPVEAIAFVVPGFPFENGQRLLDLYARQSSRFSYRIIDPQERPALAIEYQVQSAGTVVFVSGDRQTKTLTATEQEFTSALLKVTATSQPFISFLTGHGERDPQDGAQKGYATLRRLLEQENYQVSSLSLLASSAVASETAVIVIAGPTKAPLPDELQAIASFLKTGGRALFLVDPDTPAEWGDLLTPWGIERLPGRVLDAGSYLNPDQGTPAILPGQYPSSTITQGLIAATFFPASVAFATPTPATGVATVAPLLRTSSQSWRQTSPEQTTPAEAPAEQRGPLVIGASVEESANAQVAPDTPPAKRTRLVVIGDSDFAANQFVTFFANGDLVLNSVSWLAQQEELISIRPNPSSARPIFLTAQGSRWVLLTTLLLLPLLPAALGVSLRWRRR